MHKDDHGSSLLADAFNVHWCNALNLQLAGKSISRFVMMHDDIVPQNDWLTALLTVLDETGADVVAVANAIKDTRGLTSTALDDPDDPWEVYRRLALKEMKRLPETFTAHDCDSAGLGGKIGPGSPTIRALLPNTGLWACRMDRPWRHRVHFQIHNRIAFRLGDNWPGGEALLYKAGDVIPVAEYVPGMPGQFLHQVMSEDWDFGRQLARLGCDVRVTRAVRTQHVNAGVPFNNYDLDWGDWDNDRGLIRKWSPSRFGGVEGWLSEDEGRFLAELARGHDILEIGSYCGLSTLWLASTAKHVTCVDTFDGRGTPAPRDTYEEFRENIGKHGMAGKVSAFRGTSTEFGDTCLAKYKTDQFDLIFVDGAHDAHSVREDIRVAHSLVNAEGWIALHDYGSDVHPDVKRVVDSLVSSGGFKKLGVGGSIVVLQPISEAGK